MTKITVLFIGIFVLACESPKSVSNEHISLNDRDVSTHSDFTVSEVDQAIGRPDSFIEEDSSPIDAGGALDGDLSLDMNVFDSNVLLDLGSDIDYGSACPVCSEGFEEGQEPQEGMKNMATHCLTIGTLIGLSVG